MVARESWARSAAVSALLLGGLTSCGPHHHGGDPGGAAGAEAEGGEAGTGGTAGTSGSTGTGGVAGTDTGGTAGTDTGGTAGASGGTAGSDTGGTAGSGTGGTSGAPGYDRVIGCPAVARPETAQFTLLGSMNDRFFPSAISGDGRVVAGTHDSVPVRWRLDGGFEPIEGGDGAPIQLSCDGEVAVVRAFADGIYRQTAAEGLTYLFANSDDSGYPINLSPDGSVIIGNLNPSHAGPFPVRWTREGGAELVDALKNSVVYNVSPDGQSLLGADILHIYRWRPDTGKTALYLHPPLGGDGPPIMPVSADGNVFAFTLYSTEDSMVVARSLDTPASLVPCQAERCAPIELSGTGQVVLAWEASADGSGIWTQAHGFRDVGQLIEQFGGDTQGRLIQAIYMSDDGQAFAGLAADPNNPFDYQGFYATLPAAAYE